MPRLTPLSPHVSVGWCLVLAVLAGLAPVSPARAQGVDPAARPIAEVRIQGLVQVNEQLVRNQIRSEPGDPYDPQTVERDIVRITHLGRFSNVQATVTPRPDGSVVLTYRLTEQPLLEDVQVVGNKALEDQELLAAVGLRAGDPVDPFLIDKARRQILDLYADDGYFVADVSYDGELLAESNILVLRVREGPKVRIRGIRFEGNESFRAKELRAQVRSRTYFPIFRQGELNREQLELDAARVRDYLRDRGYLDAQVGRRIALSPDQRDAVVTFVVYEGPQYLVDRIEVVGADLFPEGQVLQNLALRRGDFFSAGKVRDSVQRVQELYGKLGYLETQVAVEPPVYHEAEPRVDVRMRIEEGRPYEVGKVSVRGNELTRTKVVLRQLRGATPGRRFDRGEIDRSRQRLAESSLFSDATVTILDDPADPTRDVLVEVQERNTGSLSFGAGLSSDAGLLGAIDLVQRNFDITDTPESFGELITGQAFRGGGQFFALSLQPGNETSRYSVSFRDPYVLETNYFLDTSLSYFERQRDEYDEARAGASWGLGQRFGDVWSASTRFRVEEVQIDSLAPSAPVDVFNIAGTNLVTGVGLSATRSTTDSAIFPTRGSRLRLGIERVGALGGDFDFTKLTGEFRKFWTVDEDFLGRKTVVSWRLEAGWIPEAGEAPTFERFFAGGQRSFRGFEFRGVGPRGVRNDNGLLGDEAVGDRWLLLTGLQYEFPLVSDFIRGVLFTDQGTLTSDPGFEDWRVSVGAGVRIKIPFLGQAPFALDLAVPVVSEDTDEDQLISFDLALPFR